MADDDLEWLDKLGDDAGEREREPASEDIFPAGAGPAGQPVTWSFPVEIEVVGGLSEEHLRVVARHVFDELDVALRAVGRA
jgi:hypothetical protein